MDWFSKGGSVFGSVFATLMVLGSLPKLIPAEIYEPVKSLVMRAVKRANTTVTFKINDVDEDDYYNDVYDLVDTYLGDKSISSAKQLTLWRSMKSKDVVYSMAPNNQIVDTFQDLKLTWSSFSAEGGGKGKGPRRVYQLSFREADRHKVQTTYIPQVLEAAARIKFKNRERKIYSNRPSFSGYSIGDWTALPFSHPATLNTLALDPDLKKDIVEDLTKFVASKEYYASIGRAWKRGYLLYGPPGTGKTSLIAAIANFLDFDIYDLELTAVSSNSHLRNLLLSTSSKSVIVIEDIDCTGVGCKRTRDGQAKNGAGGNSSVSLSGVLNFADGLWSSCGEERLMIFTTNYKESLDPALLRPGRMDKHINLSYCGFEAFKMLTKNYLGVDDHELMGEVENSLPSVEMTPADIAEILMGHKDDPDLGMSGVVEQIKKRPRRIQITSEDPIDD